MRYKCQTPFMSWAVVWIVAVTLVLSLGGNGHAFWKQSEGFRMGLLAKTSLKGTVGLRNAEGQLFIGRDSSFYEKQLDGKRTTVNPWYFSADAKLMKQLLSLAGQYVVIHYRQESVSISTKDTDYRVLDVYPVTREYVPDFRIENPRSLAYRSEGFRSGRLVKISRKGKIVKTTEIIMQLGNAGNMFKHMSVNDKKVTEHLIKCLKSGRRYNVQYVDLGKAKTNVNLTRYVILGTEIPKNDSDI